MTSTLDQLSSELPQRRELKTILDIFHGIKTEKVFTRKRPSEIRRSAFGTAPLEPQDPVKIIKEVKKKIIPSPWCFKNKLLAF